MFKASSTLQEHCAFGNFPIVRTWIAPRCRANKSAVAEYGGDNYPCTVRDLSATGAAIEFPDLVSLLPFAKAFNLILKDDGLKLPCRIVWKRNYRMGVTFD